MQTHGMMKLRKVAAGASKKRTGRVYYTIPYSAKADETIKETDWSHRMKAGDSLSTGLFFKNFPAKIIDEITATTIVPKRIHIKSG